MSKLSRSKSSPKPNEQHQQITFKPTNLVALNQKHRLHITTISHILRNRPLEELESRVTQNLIEVNFPNSPERARELWKQYRVLSCHRWKGGKASFRGYFESVTVNHDQLQMILRWKERQSYKLRHISLIFNRSRHTEKELFFEVPYRMTRHLENLEEFTLDFDNNTNITDETLKKMGSTLARNLPKLKQLNIGLYSCKEITGKGLCWLMTPVCRHMRDLTQLYLNFGGCGKIEDKHLKYFAANVGKRLVNLNRLILYFWQAREITNEGLLEFGSLICHNLINLRKLSLNLRACGSITTEGIDGLGAEIACNLINLKELVLIVEHCVVRTENSQLEEYQQDLKKRITETMKKEILIEFDDDPNDEVFFLPYATNPARNSLLNGFIPAKRG